MPRSWMVVSARVVAASRVGRASGRIAEGDFRGWTVWPLMESWEGRWARWIPVPAEGGPKPGLTGVVKSRVVVQDMERGAMQTPGSMCAVALMAMESSRMGLRGVMSIVWGVMWYRKVMWSWATQLRGS